MAEEYGIVEITTSDETDEVIGKLSEIGWKVEKYGDYAILLKRKIPEPSEPPMTPEEAADDPRR